MSTSSEIRTHVLTLKGLRPGPLDDGGSLINVAILAVVFLSVKISLRLVLFNKNVISIKGEAISIFFGMQEIFRF